MPDRYYSTLRYNFVWDDDKNAENYRKHALFVVYCDRENTRSGVDDIRIISARPATKHEIEAYNNNIRGRY